MPEIPRCLTALILSTADRTGRWLARTGALGGLALALLMAAPLAAAGPKDGFRPIFNGKDLSGWVNVNCAPETWTVRDGVLHCTGLPTGALRTVRQYENFVLELEWRHLSVGGNSGVFLWGSPIAAPGVPFLRGIEVQVLDHGYAASGKNEWYTTHGDVFPIHGATMKPFGRHQGMRSFPSAEHSKGSPEWNHYRITATNGVLRLAVNGVEVSGGAECNYRKGYLALESEGAPVEYRNVRLLELDPSGTPAALTAPLDTGWRALFTGLDLRGWRTNGPVAGQWAVRGERLHRVGSAEVPAGNARPILWTTRSFRDAEFLFDCRPSEPTAGKAAVQPVVWIRGADGVGTEVKLPVATPGKHQRYAVRVLGKAVTISRDEQVVDQWTLPEKGGRRGEFGLDATGPGLEFFNVYFRDAR
jgi:hypothetical protein